MNPLTIIVAIGWIIFWVYWFIAAFRSKTTIHFNARRFVSSRIIIFVLVLGLILLSRRLSLHFGNLFLANNETMAIIGFILFVLGIALAFWARIILGQNWGMPMSEKQDPQLVTTGPYRFVRHPIYSGMLMMMLGSIFVVNIFWVPVFIIGGGYFIYSAITEEKMMTHQFPKVYPAYKRRTKMLLPFIF